MAFVQQPQQTKNTASMWEKELGLSCPRLPSQTVMCVLCKALGISPPTRYVRAASSSDVVSQSMLAGVLGTVLNSSRPSCPCSIYPKIFVLVLALV